LTNHSNTTDVIREIELGITSSALVAAILNSLLRLAIKSLAPILVRPLVIPSIGDMPRMQIVTSSIIRLVYAAATARRRDDVHHDGTATCAS